MRKTVGLFIAASAAAMVSYALVLAVHFTFMGGERQVPTVAKEAVIGPIG